MIPDEGGQTLHKRFFVPPSLRRQDNSFDASHANAGKDCAVNWACLPRGSQSRFIPPHTKPLDLNVSGFYPAAATLGSQTYIKGTTSGKVLGGFWEGSRRVIRKFSVSPVAAFGSSRFGAAGTCCLAGSLPRSLPGRLAARPPGRLAVWPPGRRVAHPPASLLQWRLRVGRAGARPRHAASPRPAVRARPSASRPMVRAVRSGELWRCRRSCRGKMQTTNVNKQPTGYMTHMQYDISTTITSMIHKQTQHRKDTRAWQQLRRQHYASARPFFGLGSCIFTCLRVRVHK